MAVVRKVLQPARKDPKDPYCIGDAPSTQPEPSQFGSYFTHNPFPMPDMLTVPDIAGMCQLSLPAAHQMIYRELPDYAVVRLGKKALRVHSWAMAWMLRMTHNCPGCGRPWPEERI